MNFIDYLNLPACVRLTIALAHFLWQGLAFALLTVIAAKLFGSHSSRIRYIAYVTCLFGMVIALCMTYTLVDVPAKPIAEESFFEAESIPAKSQLVVSTSEPTLPGTIEPVKISSVESASDIEAPKPVTLTRLHSSIDLQHYVPYAASLYFLGVIVMLGRLLIGLQGGQRLRKFSQPVGDPVVVAALARQARELGMVFTPAIAYCKRVMVPTVVGILKPAILLPFSFASGLSPLQVEMLLTHELAHIHRYDPLINVIQKIIEALLFFHPAVWFISHRARIERENCCDDVVVGAGGKAAEYAASLVEMAEKMMASKQGVLVEGVCATGCPSRLKQRILRLTGRPTCQQVRLTNVWAVVLALLVISFFALTTFPGNRPEGTKRDGREVEVRKGPPVQEPKVSVVAKSSGLRAILTAKQLSIMPGKPVVVELYLQNVSEEEIIYVDFKTNFFLDEIELTTLLVDGRLVCMHTLLDVNDDGYKVIAEHKPNNVATEGFVSYTPLPIPREAFVVLKPGEKVAYLKVDLQPVQFRHETSKQALGPLQIPGEHTIQVEYHNRAHGRQFGLNAWTGKVRSNVVTVRINSERLLEEDKLGISNLLSELEKLEDEHLKIRKEKIDSMSDAEKRRLATHNMAVTSGMERELRTLSGETARQIAAFGEQAVPVLLDELRSLPREFRYSRRCVVRSLAQIGAIAAPYLTKALQAHPLENSDIIIPAIGQIRDVDAVDLLLGLFDKSDKEFRNMCAAPLLHHSHKGIIATALGNIGDKRAVEPIVGAFEESLEEAGKSDNWDAKREQMMAYIQALGRLGDKRAIPVLRRVLSAGPQTTKAGKEYLLAEEAARALRSLTSLERESKQIDREWTGKLGGEVIAPDGKLLVDAKVRGYRMRHNHYFFGVDPQAAEPLENVQTDKMGQFVFSTFPTAVEVTHKDWPGWKAQIRSQDRKFKVLTMRRGYAVNGSVLNEDGEPIKGVQITLEMHTGVVAAALLWSEFVTLGSVTPEEDGSFLLQGLVPGNKYRLAVYAQGYVRHVTDLFECLGSDTAKLNPIKLARGTALNFTVLSPEGKALPNTLLQISDSSAFSCALDWFCGTGRTDSTGKVTISDLPAGKIWVCVHAEGFLDRKWHRCYYCESDRNVTVVMKGTQHTRARPAEDAGNDIGIGPSQRVLKATSPPEVIVEPSGLESDPLAPMGDMPDDAQKVLKEYFRCVEWGDPELLEEILCFNDERDRELFIAFSSSRGKIYVRPELFLSGKPIEQKRAAEDCWIVVLDGGYLLELWKVNGKWKVLCPLPGRKRMAEAKLTRAETYRHLLAEEIKQVESESDVQLRRRRQRYLAVLDLSGRHQIKHLAYYFSGIPTNDPAILSGMSNEQFRESVILKLDAPDGLRYRVDPEQKALLEGKPVFVTFFMENVTSGNIILEYRPAVEIVDSSNAITARGALVFPRGEKTAELIKSPYRGKLAYPLKKREVKIAPGATFTMRVNLLEYYDLPPARYTISSRIDIDNTGQGYWRGHAMSDTTSFEIMPLPAGGSPDPNMAIVAGKVTDTATGKGVAGIPIILGARAVTATLSDGTYRATNVAPGRTSVGARDKDWYLVPHRQGAISAYYNYLQYENVNLEAGKETHLDMQVTKGGKIKGTVRDASGKAVSGTIIWIINQREDDSIVAAETREFGNYTSYGLALGTPLEFLVWTSDGRGSARRTITLEAGEIREVDFILDPENEYRIVGKVSDSSGRGVPNLPMRCWWRERNRRCHRSLHTDKNGNFFFSGLEPGMEYEVYAYGKSAGFDTVNKSVRMLANERTVPLYFYLQKREEKPAPTATRKKADVSVGAESYELRISKILQHLYKEMQKAYEDVGLSKEDIQGLLSVQLPQKAIGGKWEAYREAWPAIVKARNAAIEEMASLGPSAVPFLLEAEDKSNERRGADIFVLAITKVGKTAVPVVIDGLSHVNAVVRARAATSLGKMGDSRAVEPLIRSLSDPDKRVVGAAVWSLGLLKDNAATEPLLELWHKEQVDSRTLIASALGQIGDKRAAKPIMVALEEYVSEARQTGNWDINSWAMRVYAGALGQIGDTRAIPLLKRTLRAGPQKTKVGPPKYLVAQEAAQALRSLGVKVQGEKGDYRIIEIAPLLQKPDAINQELPDGARVIYVDADADGANNGSSWIDAYRYLQDALVVARSGDKIRVAQGVYKPDQGKGQAPGDRQRTFRLGQAVVKGGYAGFGSPDPNERDISRFETVLSGDLNGDDEPNFVNTDDNSFRVITTTDDVILDGFIITGGNSDGSGAGMTCVAANATISNCIFRGNAAVHGGAMYISGRKAKRVAGKFIGLSPVLTNCTFVNNSAVYAGAIAINDSSPNFRDCIFVGNSALSLTSSSGIGGAIRNVFSDPNLFNCLFKENSAVRGGAIFNQQSNSIFAQCTFVANSVRIARRTGIGSAIYNTHSNPRLTSCVFSENWPDEAGPIHNHESSPTLTNCKFNGNRGAAEEGVRPAPEPEGVRQQRDYEAARTVPQPIELWKAREYGCGGSPRTALKLRTDVKRRYPILLTWPLIQDASKYVVQIQGLRGSRPARSFESTTNSLRLEKADLVPGRYQWSVSVYDRHGKHIGNIETIDPVEIFAIEDPQPVAANGKRVMIDLNHSAGHIRGWGYYNHAQYITKELLENAGFEVQVNERDLLTREKLKSVDLLICHYYWAGWPGFRPYSKSEISAVRQFVEMGGSLLVVGCDRKDGGGKMSEAGSELVKEFGLLFELDKISEQHNWAEVTPNQNVISLTRPVNMQLPVGVVGENAATLLQFDGVPIVKAKQFGYGKVIVAGVGMSFLDCYLGDFERRESLHLIMFFDFIKYLTGIDWKNNCNKEFVDVILSRSQFQDK